jgi:AraC-like DNA-binding protein
MAYREHAPPPALAAFVTCFWEIDGGVSSHRVLPDGAMDVLFAAGDAAARVIGPMTRAIVTPDDGGPWVVGVRFRPGAALGLVGVAARELLDDAAEARDVWGAEGRSLDARLVDASDSRAARACLSAALLARLPQAGAPDARLSRAVATLTRAAGELPIPAVASEVGVGERQLERLFVERVGYGPKLFARVVRLDAATRAIATRGTTSSWATVAARCGYSDQAHLVREFRALTGVTPVVYARERGMSEIDNTSVAGDAKKTS